MAQKETEPDVLQRERNKGAKGHESWGRGTVPNALLKLLVKDKPLCSRKVHERRETKLPRRGKQGYSAWETDWQLKTPRIKKITADKDQSARKVSSWNPWGETTLQRMNTSQSERLAVETTEEKSSHNSQCFNSVPFKAKMSCKHDYIRQALFRKISWLSFTQSLMDVCILTWRVVT